MFHRNAWFVAACVGSFAGVAGAQTYTENFADANLGGARLYGDASVEGGSLRLTPLEFGRSGAMVIGGGAVSTFVANFEYFFNTPGGNFTADGMSFTLGRVPDDRMPGAAELGSGSGLTVCFDIFDFNGDGTVNDDGIRVLFNGQVIAEVANAITAGDEGNFRAVQIRLHDASLLDVRYNGHNAITNLPIPDFQPDPSYRFAFAARTGAERSEQRIDNLSLEARAIVAEDCRHVNEIFGDGVYWFDNFNAQTDGVPNALCQDAASNDITGDLWWCWTATHTGVTTVSTIGLSSRDTKLAVYQDCVPCSEALGIMACNDDANGTIQSLLTFSAQAGTRYLIRVGNYLNSPRGPGAVSISTREDCNADFNGDHSVNSQDFFDFLTAFFRGC